MDRDEINVADLKLDQENPRHEPAKSQREIIHALLTDGGSKLVKLADDIATNGLNPLDGFLVLRESASSMVVLEGNRRLASIKLLANPELTSIPKYQKRFRDLRRKVAAPIHTVPCAIVTSREEGKHWQELRHTGEREGRGVVPWDTAASTRFHGRRGSQADRALAVLDALQSAFAHNARLEEHIKDVRKNKLTTFGRLVSDPFVRGRFGLELSPTVVAHYPSEAIEPGIERVLEDLHAGTITVSGLKSKDQRRKYILDVPLPDEKAYEPDPRALVPAGTPRPPAPKPKPLPKPSSSTPAKPLFDGVQLTNLGGRIADILVELQKLDVDRYPNACAALLRVVVELAVTEVHLKKGWSMSPSTKLRELVKKCVKELDPSEKDPRYQSVRAGLNDGTSMFAVATIHAFLHNSHYKPTPSEVRSTSSNYAPFLAALDTLV